MNLQAKLNFPFTGFFSHEEKIKQWDKAASDLLSKLEYVNCGLSASTGSGKTIIAFYCLSSLKAKTLFLSPSRILCQQHHAFYQQVTGKNDSTVITGSIKKEARNWQNKKYNVIFATPHVFLADLNSSKIDINKFQFLIIDECHKAAKKYPYVEIAKTFNKKSVKILALSASPGKNKTKILEVSKNCHINYWQQVSIKTPTKLITLSKIPLDENLDYAQKVFDTLKKAVVKKIKELCLENKIIAESYFSYSDKFIISTTLKLFQDKSSKLEGNPFYKSKFLYALYQKLSHLESCFMTKSYFSFNHYLDKLRVDKAKSAKAILNNELVKELEKISRDSNNVHPKVDYFLKIIELENEHKKQGLIFINDKELALYLSKLLNDKGFKSDCLFGKKDSTVKKQKELIKNITDKKVSYILATSVVEEGLSLPNFDFVLNYTLSDTSVSLIQRMGRTARFAKGKVYILALNNEEEQYRVYKGFSSILKMINLEYSDKDSLKANKKNKPGKQLSLF